MRATSRPSFVSVARGDSIAVNGACLTVAELGPGTFSADVSTETLAVTTLGDLVVDSPRAGFFEVFEGEGVI